MKTIICFVRSRCGILGLIFCSSIAQATMLHSNDVIVFQFSALPWTHVTSSPYPAPFVDLFYRGTNGDSFRTEFFEDSTLQSPFYSNVNSSSLPESFDQETMWTFNFPTKKWTDRQGVIRFTGLSGTIILTNITIQVWDGTNLYRQILPITQPPSGLASQVTLKPAIEISWPTQSTNNYQIQWSSSLNPNDWFNLDAPLPGTGTTSYYLISTQSTERRFFRVVTLSP